MPRDHADVASSIRGLVPQVLGAVVRRFGHFHLAEDAVQEAVIAAAAQWPRDGVPDDPRAWLITVASRRLTDLLRREQARRRREDRVASWQVADDRVVPAVDRSDLAAGRGEPGDDTLVLLFLCCHPSLTRASQIALTLRAVAGLTTAEIARAFLVPGDTMTRRITRAKSTIERSGIPFRLPDDAERAARLEGVLHVLYLTFNEGYLATEGPRLYRQELTSEAISLTRMLHRLLPEDAEVAGLLALMLLTDARRSARLGPDGTLIPMGEQDRSLWDAQAIAEGVALVTDALPRGPTGPYQLQAAITAIHDEASSAQETDWPQILALYELLLEIADTPVVALNHAVAVAMTNGAAAGLARVEALAADRRLANGHRLVAVRAHLLEMAGDVVGARRAFEEAAARTTSLPEQRYLFRRAAGLVSAEAGTAG